MSKSNTEKIRSLNDAFRRNPTRADGRVDISCGVHAGGAEFVARAIVATAAFDAFTEDNDPHGEHDFGSFEIDGDKIFWKIDYYAPDLLHGSEDPSDPKQTVRVLTIMLAEEY